MTSRLIAMAVALGLAATAASGSGAVSFRRIAIPDEVPAHLTTALAQDAQGFLWIGTQAGLVRFDGSRFKVFRSNPDDPSTLSASYVRTLLAAKDGRVWAGTFSGGLSVFDPVRESFVRFRHDPADPKSLAHDRVEGLAEDRGGNIWAATNEGVDRIDIKTGSIVHFRHDPANPKSLADDHTRALLVDRQGRVWVGSRKGLQVWRGEKTGFERIGDFSGETVAKLFEDGRGRIWIGTAENGAGVFDPRTGRFDRLLPRPRDSNGLSHFWVYGFAQAGPDEIWIATFGGGVDVVDARSLQVVDRLQHDPNLESAPGGDRIGAILRDRSGVIWVGTWGQGISRHDPATRAFRTIRYSPNLPGGLSHPQVVRTLETRDGAIWVGTNGNGVDLFDRNLNRTGGHRPDPLDPGALSTGEITCLAEGRDGSVWVATLDGNLHRMRPGALHRLRPQSTRFERLTPAQGLPGGAIRALTSGPRGELWIGAAEGLARLDPLSGELTVFRHRPDDPASLSGTAVEAIAFGRDGTLWVGTDSGLNAFDPETGKAVRILSRPNDPASLPNNWVPDLMVAADGKLWVATQGGACLLTSWDGKTARFERVANRTSLHPVPVEALIQEFRGLIWLGPRLRLDPHTWRWQELGPADGVELRSFFIASRTRTVGGMLLFGSPEGLHVVHPEGIVPWTWQPPVVATALRVDGLERPGASRVETLTLSPPERGFRLDFAALDFTAPDKLQYRYRLEGYDKVWIATDANQASLTYTNLSPGSYSLRVQGTNRAGLWSDRELRLTVTVLPAYYETAWFRTLAVALLATLIYGLFRLRIRQLERRGLELERMVGERTATLEERGQELQAAYIRIQEASLTDPLTGLRNRRFVDQSISSDVELSIRKHEDGRPEMADLLFLILDLDHFKRVNDKWGHAAGDTVLVQTAAVLRSVMRSSDHLVRWGGEEFLAVVRFTDRREAPELAEKVRAAIAGHSFELPDGKRIHRTCSIGVAAFPLVSGQPRAVSWQETVALADRALYVAKAEGRNRWASVVAGDLENPQDAVRRFQEDPSSGEIRLVRPSAPGGGGRV